MASIVTTSPRSKPSGLPQFLSRHILIAAAIVILVAVAYLILRDGKAPSEPSPPGKSSVAAAPSAAPVNTPAESHNPSGFKEQTSAVVTNASGSTTEIHAGVYDEPEILAEGADIDSPATSNKSATAHRVMPQHKKYFDNPVENQLERLAIPGRNIRATPPPSKLTQDEVLEFLRRPIQIEEDDDEETVAAKERTAALKTEALKFIENGGTYDEFVREMIKVSNEEADMIRDARTEMMRLYKEEGAIAAIEYLKVANAALKENGLKEIPISSGLRKRAEEEQAALEAAH